VFKSKHGDAHHLELSPRRYAGDNVITMSFTEDCPKNSLVFLRVSQFPKDLVSLRTSALLRSSAVPLAVPLSWQSEILRKHHIEGSSEDSPHTNLPNLQLHSTPVIFYSCLLYFPVGFNYTLGKDIKVEMSLTQDDPFSDNNNNSTFLLLSS
jgi:hypothetical protein